VKYCSKDGNVRWRIGLEEEKQKTNKKEDQEEYYRGLIEDARTLSMQAFEAKHPKEWFLRREKIEKLMIESMGRRATIWKGKLPSKNFWIWGSRGWGKANGLNNKPLSGKH
jgi:hypothetical protein